MSLADHLNELRRRLLISIAAIFVGGLIGYFAYVHILSFFLHPYCQILKSSHHDQPCTLLVQDPVQQLTIRLKVSFFAGCAIALPVILWETWRFITPGLHPREKRYAVPFVGASMVLFALGALVALGTFPYALRFFNAVGSKQVGTIYAPDPYLRLIMLMMVVYGLGFEFPVLLVALLLARILSTQKLRKWRRYAFVGVVAAAGIFTPSSDPVSMFALAIPLYLFYEAAIIVGRLLKR
jgi:sec-independent protein translocase protein TatC